MNTFKKLKLEHWRQFEKVDLDFNSKLCVLTGKNGCGKTTILNLLGKHFGWHINFISTPYIGKSKLKFWTDSWGKMELTDELKQKPIKIGELLYSNGKKSELLVPQDVGAAQYQIQFQNVQIVQGLTIPSHRPASSYNNIDTIPTNPKTNQQQFEEFQQLLLQTYGSMSHKNPGVILKQSLISLAVFGYGNSAVAPNPEYKELFEKFQEILLTILPTEIGFERLEIRMPDIVLITKSGTFNLDAMSGGISSIFCIAWQIHMYGANKDSCTILIDEPENHLHPSMQREFLPGLEKAFPNYNFIIATHSPFILASLPDAQVYALVFNNNAKIESKELKEVDLVGSANKILRDILDVPNTMPKWVEDKVRNILSQYTQEEYNEDRLKEAFAALKEQGLNETLQDFKL